MHLLWCLLHLTRQCLCTLYTQSHVWYIATEGSSSIVLLITDSWQIRQSSSITHSLYFFCFVFLVFAMSSSFMPSSGFGTCQCEQLIVDWVCEGISADSLDAGRDRWYGSAEQNETHWYRIIVVYWGQRQPAFKKHIVYSISIACYIAFLVATDHEVTHAYYIYTYLLFSQSNALLAVLNCTWSSLRFNCVSSSLISSIEFKRGVASSGLL